MAKPPKWYFNLSYFTINEKRRQVFERKTKMHLIFGRLVIILSDKSFCACVQIPQKTMGKTMCRLFTLF